MLIACFVAYQFKVFFFFLCILLYSFYNKTFEDQFHMCLEFPAQNRYIIAFPLVCGHFQSCAHELCPEEVKLFINILIHSIFCQFLIFIY